MLVAAGAFAWVVAHVVSGRRAGAHGADDLHSWMHQHLVITPEQEAALAPVEAAFEAERQRLTAEIDEAGRRLAAAVRDGGRESAAVAEALGHLHRAQGELQRVTLDHFFAMRDHLDADQAERLLGWTCESIVNERDR
jgi:hypothetical protein